MHEIKTLGNTYQGFIPSTIHTCECFTLLFMRIFVSCMSWFDVMNKQIRN